MKKLPAGKRVEKTVPFWCSPCCETSKAGARGSWCCQSRIQPALIRSTQSQSPKVSRAGRSRRRAGTDCHHRGEYVWLARSRYPSGAGPARYGDIWARAGPAPLGHHTNLPLERRFCASQNPWPSYASTRIEVALRLRKTNRQPENGSASSLSRHN